MTDKIKVILKTDDFLAINKPAGLLTHPIREGHEEESLVDWLLDNYPEVREVGDSDLRPGIVHRLDRETSGIMVIPRNEETFKYLKSLFQDKTIKKTYLALVFGKFKEKSGMIDKPIGIIKSSIKRSTEAKNMRDIKEAVTEYQVVEEFVDKEGKDFSLLEVYPKTGRTNQIRVHLSSINRPIVGDTVYAPKGWLGPNKIKTRMFLHAFSLEFKQLNGLVLKLEADMPKELKDILKSIN